MDSAENFDEKVPAARRDLRLGGIKAVVVRPARHEAKPSIRVKTVFASIYAEDLKILSWIGNHRHCQTGPLDLLLHSQIFNSGIQ